MNNYLDSFSLKLSIIALRAALLSMAVVSVAYAGEAADEASAAELVKPISQIEIGGIYINNKNWKYGEYNGLDDKSTYGIANIDVRGGAAYDSGETGRWSFKASDLALDTRKMSAEFGRQGKFRINLGYDQFVKNGNGDYQTPYITNGTNNFVLPSGWIKPVQGNVNPKADGSNYPAYNGSSTGYNTRALSKDYVNNDYLYRLDNTGAAFTTACTTTPATKGKLASCGATSLLLPDDLIVNHTTGWAAGNTYLDTMLNTAATDTALFHNVKIDTKRRKYDVGGVFNIENQWDITGSISHEDKTGTRLQEFVPNGEKDILLPIDMDQSHDQFNLALNYTGDKSFFKAAYYGSVFTQNNKVVSFQNPTTDGNNGQDITPPSNQLHEARFTGGYNFTPSTKLVGEFSYGRNTQNDAFLRTSLIASGYLPEDSLHGEVINKTAYLKLTAKPIKDLNVSAGYKYDDRNNQTPVKTFAQMDIDTVNSVLTTNTAAALYNNALHTAGLIPSTDVINTGSTGVNIWQNRAYSKTSHRVNLDADYLIAQGNAVKVGYDFETIDRHCNDSWVSCADAERTNENTVRAEYRNTMIDNVTAKIGYAFSVRNAQGYNPDAFLALTPAANLVPNQTLVNTGGYSLYSFLQSVKSLGITAYGPVKGWPTDPVTHLPLASTAVSILPGVTAAMIDAAPGTTAYLAVRAWKSIYPGLTTNQAIALTTFMGPGGQITAATYYANGQNLMQMPGQQMPYVGDRDRNKVRASTNWQATDRLTLTGGVDFNLDNFKKTTVGLQDSKSYAINLDSTFAFNDKVSTSAYYSYSSQRQNMTFDNYGTNAATGTATGSIAADTAGSILDSGGVCYSNLNQRAQNFKIDPCNKWGTSIHDQNNTLGFNLLTKGLLTPKLDLGGDLLFTWAKTTQDFSGLLAVNSPLTVDLFGASATTWTTAYVPMQSLPDVNTRIVTLKLNGKYAVDKRSTVRVGYTYQHLISSDWFYESLQSGNTPTGILPTNEKAPSYNVHSVGAAYIYSF